MPAAFAAAWMARDAGALAALFAPDADFVNVVGIWWRDRAAIEAAHDYALKSFFADSRLVPGRVSTRRLGADAAVVHCRFRLTGQHALAGGRAGPRSTILCFVMARGSRGWHCVAAQNTDIVPGAETQEAGPDGLAAQDYRTGRGKARD
jgi:uncharacterized protein (TIGR02246 family)